MRLLIILLVSLVVAQETTQESQKPPHLEDRKISISIDVPGQGGEYEPYFATFDATNIAMQWQSMAASYDNKKQYSIGPNSVETSGSSGSIPKVSDDDTISDAEAVAEAIKQAIEASEAEKAKIETAAKEASAAEQAKTAEPSGASDGKSTAIVAVDPSELARRRLAARDAFTKSKIFGELNVLNVMWYVLQHQPFALVNLCDCPDDYELSVVLPELEQLVQAEGLHARMKFVYIWPSDSDRFQLSRVFELGQSVITVIGDSEIQEKTVFIPYGRSLQRIPASVHVELFEECCGDKFDLTVGELAANGFHLKIKRTDADHGWGQRLQIAWRLPEPLHPLPAFILDNIPHGSNNEKHVFRPDDWPNETDKARKIMAWIHSFQAATLPLLVRSQPLPVSPPLTRTPGKVVDVVGANFQDIVLDRNKDVLLLVYSPFCGASIAVQSLFEQVATDLKDETNAFVARIDKTVNDLPITGVVVAFYPTAFLFPACEYGASGCPLLDFNDFNGSKLPHNRDIPHSHYTREGLVTFVREHGFTYQGINHKSF